MVTADADGQHAPADILRVARRLMEHPDALVLGAREFPAHIPLRSRFGNVLTRLVFLVFTGKLLRDTQTGLRGWPAAQCRDSLRVPIQGYDFGLEDPACGGRGGAIEEVGIETIYLDGNRASHFNPLRDSFRIYFVFLRYCRRLRPTGCRRGHAGLQRRLRPLRRSRPQSGGGTDRRDVRGVPRSALGSVPQRRRAVDHLCPVRRAGGGFRLGQFGLIELLRDQAHLPVLGAKLLAEGLLFLGNFAIQRQFVFTKR